MGSASECKCTARMQADLLFETIVDPIRTALKHHFVYYSRFFLSFTNVSFRVYVYACASLFAGTLFSSAAKYGRSFFPWTVLTDRPTVLTFLVWRLQRRHRSLC